jgi:parallel beta-helix repeat protein
VNGWFSGQEILTNAEPVWSRNLDKNAFTSETRQYHTGKKDLVLMKRTALTLTLISVLLGSAIAITPCVRFASAQTKSVTINADGSVSPSTAPIQRVGDLYLLTGDVGQITVKRSNMTLDGRGYTIQGENSQTSNSNIGGISLTNVQNVTVKGFSIKDCSFGVSLNYCSNITISGNNITGTWQPLPFSMLAAGIFVWDGDCNIITGNRLENNDYGMYLGENSEYNVIGGNTILSSNRDGIRLFESSGNTFYHNNFDNEPNVYDSSLSPYSSASLSINAWDNGQEGNFWSDYNGTDADGDGIGDTPYKLDSRNTDRYPLIKPFNSTLYLQKTTPPEISVLSPVNQVFNESSVPLLFTVDKQAVWMGYSLNGQDNVTISGNTTITDLPNGLHNVTFYVRDEFDNMGASETIYFSVNSPEPFPITLVVATIASVVVGICLLVYFKKRKC